MEYANLSETIVLVSGDGDFDLLAQRIIGTKNAVVEVYGVEALTTTSLIDSAIKFVPIESSFWMD